jgi:multiple sugar transport system ATP-binding protein
MTQVTLSHVSLTRGSTPILRDVNLHLNAGEFCVFVGPSGCGKSTLLRLIAGLDDDHEGEIAIDGQAMQGVPPAKREVAMVFQGYALYPHMTVRDNMAFALHRAKLPQAEIEARLANATRILQLEDYLQRKPGALSGGQRQRVAIGRAIVKRPKVFLFDEPLSNLDASLRVETRMEIARLHRDMDSASMVYVTHDQVEAMTLADRIVLLRPLAGAPEGSGSVVQVGAPMELYHHPASLFVARFIGSPGMNLFERPVQAVSATGVAFELQGKTHWAAVAPGSAAVGATFTFGIRPEHVRMASPDEAQVLQGRILHVESLGEHALVFVQVQGLKAPLLLKSTEESLRVGDPFALRFDPSALHAFDPQGEALRRHSRPTA